MYTSSYLDNFQTVISSTFNRLIESETKLKEQI